MRDVIPSSLGAAVAYAGIVFAVGFLMGALRILLLVSRLGDLGAVLTELPVMIAASFLTARYLVRACRVPHRLGARLTMGGLAFVLLMLAEAALAIFGFGRSPAEHFASYAQTHALAGLTGQLVFAGIPALLLLSRRGQRS